MTLSSTEKQTLIAYARRVLETFVKTGEELVEDCPDENLLQPAGVFVTLKTGEDSHDVRGCVGFIEPTDSIWQGVGELSIGAAKDSRYPAVKENELSKIKIDISILTPPEECSLGEIKNDDGVIIENNSKSATFLPDVWRVLGNDKEIFLEQLCLKAGLPENCYKDAETKFYRYQSEVIAE